MLLTLINFLIRYLCIFRFIFIICYVPILMYFDIDSKTMCNATLFINRIALQHKVFLRNWCFQNKKPTNYDFSQVYRLCVCASGSLITEILNFITLIKTSCLHLGQNNGKFRSSVSDRILMRVLLPQTGHNNHLNCSFPLWFMRFILAFLSQYNAADNTNAAQ